MLPYAIHIGYRNSVRTDEGLALALRTATDGAAEVLGLPDYGLEVGCAADLVLVDARHPPRRSSRCHRDGWSSRPGGSSRWTASTRADATTVRP